MKTKKCLFANFWWHHQWGEWKFKRIIATFIEDERECQRCGKIQYKAT